MGFEAVIEGFGIGLSMIVPIGVQNAFVLSNGVRGQNRFAVALVCGLSDALLISLGVAGARALIASSKILVAVARWGGAAFLIWYAWCALKRAWQGESMTLNDSDSSSRALRTALLTTLAVTWLNPHVYLDAVVLLGGMAAQHPGDGRYLFGVGAALASFVWFFGLSYGSRMLALLFMRPTAWRVLDSVVAAIMLILAGKLVLGW